MTCLLLLFYTVESLWRERQTRLAAISLATPIRTGSILLGKALANSLVGVAVIGLLKLLAAAGVLLYQRKVGLRGLAVRPGLGRPARPDLAALDDVRDGDLVDHPGAGTRPTGSPSSSWGSPAIARSSARSTGWATGRSGPPCSGATSASSSWTGRRSGSTGGWPSRPGRPVHRPDDPVLRPARPRPHRPGDPPPPGRPAQGGAADLAPRDGPDRPGAWCSGPRSTPASRGRPPRSCMKDYWRKNLATYKDWPVPDTSRPSTSPSTSTPTWAA